jgi:hypothetical protein
MPKANVTVVVRDARQPTLPTDAEVDAAREAHRGERLPLFLRYGDCLTGLSLSPFTKRRLLFDGQRVIGVLVREEFDSAEEWLGPHAKEEAHEPSA